MAQFSPESWLNSNRNGGSRRSDRWLKIARNIQTRDVCDREEDLRALFFFTFFVNLAEPVKNHPTKLLFSGDIYEQNLLQTDKASVVNIRFAGPNFIIQRRLFPVTPLTANWHLVVSPAPLVDLCLFH